MGIEQKLGNLGVVTYRLEDVVNWGRSNAMWPILFGLACCAIEMMGAQAAHYDLSRFGMELNRPSPRHAAAGVQHYTACGPSWPPFVLSSPQPPYFSRPLPSLAPPTILKPVFR